jgi:hypothetical protein
MNLDSKIYMQINNNTKIRIRVRVGKTPLITGFFEPLVRFHLETKSLCSEVSSKSLFESLSTENLEL